MSVLFSTVTLANASRQDVGVAIRATEHILIDGKSKVISAAETGRKWRFNCITQVFSNITDLVALVGTAYTLTVEGTDYTNCYLIGEIRYREVVPGTWTYSAEFVRDTSA